MTSNLCGIIGVEYGIPKQGSHSTDEQSRDQWVKGNAAFVRVGMYMYNNNQMRNKC